jgi:Holliday junction resolvasome RuvABC endonuclease subunit
LIQVLAIDPGKNAGGWAALHASGENIEEAWAWKLRTVQGSKVYEVTNEDGMKWWAGDTLASVGEFIYDETEGRYDPYALVVEGLFVGTNKKESMTLEWTAGLIASRFMCKNQGDLMRPTSMQWRPEIIGIPGNTNAKVAADMAIRWVAQNLPGMGALADNEHACEAACQALYGWRLINGKIA